MQNFKTEKLYVRVYNEIKKYIVKNQITPGEKLPTEHEMCEMLGVSRNVLREAIKALEIIGIIKSVPGRGIIVQEFNTDFLFQNMFYYLVVDNDELIKEMIQIRKVLELGFLKQAFETITEVEIEKMKELTQAMEEKHSQGQMFHSEDMEFHMLLFKNVNNKTLNSLFTAAWNVDANFSVGEKFKFLGPVSKKHRDIIDALEKRDFELFEEKVRTHFDEKTFILSKGFTQQQESLG